MNPLTPIDYAVAWAITHIHSGLGAIFGPESGWAWAGAIVILVVLMRLVLVPLFIKQLHATRKMSALAPQIAELKKKYKNDRTKLNEETMRLYKENGANPLAGCLPMVAQFPLFFALFDVLRGIAEWNPHQHPYHAPPYGLSPAVVESAQHANILGATVADRFLVKLFPPTLDNIAHSSQIVIFIFVAISATTTFMTVRQSTKRGINPNMMTPDAPGAGLQKYMAYIAPVFALSGLYWQFGLVLYWVTTNLWTLGQQFILFKRYPMPVPGAVGAAGGVVGAAPTLLSRRGTAPAGADGATAAGKTTPGEGKAAGKAGTAPSPKAVAPKGGPAKAPPKAGPSRAAPGKPGPAKAPGKAGPAKAPAKPPAPSGKPAAAPSGGSKKPGTSAGQPPATNGSGRPGVLRRLGRSRPEAEPQPAASEVKLVRQQRVRQPRAKRSGKR